jgi:nicotinate phosphoribosyltransferase
MGAPPDQVPPGSFVSGPVVLRDAALFTDLYELTMAASYFREAMNRPATFSLFVRKLPPSRGFLIAAGLEDVLEYLRALRFTRPALDYLKSLGRFDGHFLDFLAELRFTGRVRAVSEGTVVFADEPLLEVTAPMIEAQLVETAVLNCCHHQTVVASKAVRSVLAAGGRPVVEFGVRRTAGVDGGLKAARSAFIAGVGITSDVLAARSYGIPPAGTMAHSYVTAFPSELEAFRAFARAFPEQTILLLDTYDTLAAAHKAVEVARELERRGSRLAGVRLDSGDLVRLSQGVRQILKAAGLGAVQIFVSGGLDEMEIQHCLAAGAEIDAFGVGTRMNVSADAPSLDMAYKLVRYDGRDVLKLSEGKETWAGEKQVYRTSEAGGTFEEDVLALAEEPPVSGAAPLLETVMEGGQPTRPHPRLEALRDHCRSQVERLPEPVRRLEEPGVYRVRYSDRLQARQRELEAELRRTHEGTA